jgi:cell wall-associated NlpC family hydrolase
MIHWISRFLILIFIATGTACSSKHHVSASKKKKKYSTVSKPAEKKPNASTSIKKSKTKSESTNTKANKVISTAKSFIGTPYKTGGTTKAGMDCSGLMIQSFKSAGISLPRVSSEQANEGKSVSLKEILPGDMVFFGESPKSKTVNHAGLVVEVPERNKKVLFIHASTSKGVRIDDLYSEYWFQKFITARRVIP